MPLLPPTPETETDVVRRLRSVGCVFAEDEARLLVSAARTPDELAAMVDQRVAGRPLEHVLGWAEFCGRRIIVEPGVFVPRRRTEFLVRLAIDAMGRGARRRGTTPADRPVVLDLCCGSGAVSAALIASRPDGVELHAVDLDPAAVRCALRNVAATGGRVYNGDLYAPLPATLRARVDVLVANAPYVPSEEIRWLPPEARLHETRVALDGGPDGLDILRRVAAEAPQWLAPGGRLLLESSEPQADRLVAIATRAGLLARVARSAAHDATAVIGTRPD